MHKVFINTFGSILKNDNLRKVNLLRILQKSKRLKIPKQTTINTKSDVVEEE